MWDVSIFEDPLDLQGCFTDKFGVVQASAVAYAQLSIPTFLGRNTTIDDSMVEAFHQGGPAARVASADFLARELAAASKDLVQTFATVEWRAPAATKSIRLETLEATTSSNSSRRRRNHSKNMTTTPFMLERTDIFCDGQSNFHVYLRVLVYDSNKETSGGASGTVLLTDALKTEMRNSAASILNRLLSSVSFLLKMMNHVATAVLQERLRQKLVESNAVAFVADGAILPRKSGACAAPMASPPAVPFSAPEDSPMNQSVEIDLGKLRRFLIAALPSSRRLLNGCHNMNTEKRTIVTLTGLLIPRGVSLIVGGGYHGKSTLLRAIAAGVYNKVPGDGREFCATVHDAVTIRAEDGRYVNNCNVSAFISNLPTPPGVSQTIDTSHFSTGEASGSTSQAANVAEAIEMGATAFLVDEDVSAANFMARDGRMRALVMDESITPLLYRVNGLYAAHGISSIVVVGGVGDWLDVPNHVILMDKYLCKDATKKANSVSRQFSHGHVQYAGRGVVHRLPWEKSGTPIPRRPADAFSQLFDFQSSTVSLLDGSDSIALYRDEFRENSDDMEIADAEMHDDHYIDMSRCEQLMGKKPQLLGCGFCTLWLLNAARNYPSVGLPELLRMLDKSLDESGLVSVVTAYGGEGNVHDNATWKQLVENIGFAFRPRRFEVGQALTRLRGIRFEEVPTEDDGSEEAARKEAERKKQELLDLWNSRRKNKLNEADE